MMDRKFEGTHFIELSESWVVEVGGRILPTLTNYRIGAVGVVFRGRNEAEAFLVQQRELLNKQYGNEGRLLPVDDLWQFMCRAAAEGLCGFQIFENSKRSHRFMFMVRVEEAGRQLPTVLTCIDKNGDWRSSFARTGEVQLDHAEVLHWERFDILDRVSAEWSKTCPFRDWKQGDPLYELCTSDIVVLLAHVPLLGNWNSTEGAFAFFTSREEAEHYHTHHLGDGRNSMRFVGPNAPSDPRQAMASLQPTPVLDLRARLAELVEISPLSAWCVNPDGHRESSAYGRFWFGGEHAVAWMPGAEEHAPKIATVTGVWHLLKDNIFKMEKSLVAWSGRDTIFWSGGQGLQLLPLDRSFMAASTSLKLNLEDLTESEAEAVISQYLQAGNLQDLWEELVDRNSDSSQHLERFHIVCWDAVTGEGADVPWRFDNMLDALRHLAAYERHYDQQFRSEGTVSCLHMGFTGSGDSEFEDVRSARFQLGLRRLGLRLLRRGYRPQDADDLVALCNGILRTLHVDFAGYAKDLLWASDRDQEETLLKQLGIEEGIWRDWAKLTDVHIDPTGRKLVIDRMGESAWNQLLPKVQHFLATALLHLEEQGHAPQLDYAPICIEVVKALEVELGNVLEAFRNSLDEYQPVADEKEQAERSLDDFLRGKKPPTLGAISYLLRRPKKNASELMSRLHEFLASLPNGDFLTHDQFTKRDLQRVINKYRNGGVHDSRIPDDVCQECVERIIGGEANPGYIVNVSSWRRRDHTRD